MVSDEPAEDGSPMDAVLGPGQDANDAHAPLDPASILADASVVVPSRDERNYTSESAPEWLEVVVRTDEGRSVARNRGIAEATGDWIVLADDDITFPTKLTAMLVDGMHESHLVGLEDFWPMNSLLTRYMIFHRSLWETVGGFDERREHGEDTDFVYRCERAGARSCALPRMIVPHHDVDTSFSDEKHLDWALYLLRRHPLRTLPKLVKLGLRRVGLYDPQVRDYPADWTSKTTDPSERDS